MALTRLDCHTFRGEQAPKEVSSFVAINPHLQPARAVFAGSSAIRDSVGSQVAYRLALDYFIQGVEECFTEKGLGASSLSAEELTVKVVEDAFRVANTSVYSFGHKLSAGGRMAATLLGVVIDQGRLATGRVGYGSVYLFRNRQLYPFFEPPPGDVERVGDASEFPDDIASLKVSFVG